MVTVMAMVMVTIMVTMVTWLVKKKEAKVVVRIERLLLYREEEAQTGAVLYRPVQSVCSEP